MHHYSSLSSIAANLADSYASRMTQVGDAPATPYEAAYSDVLAWKNDGGEIEDYDGPRWSDPDAESYDPSPREWTEYSAWSRSLDGGCGDSELSPEERDLILASMSADEYWDMVAEIEEIMAERDAELWA
jgi:hypothetical protein